MQTIIIGGGASGMVAAITLKRNNPKMEVIILEKNEHLGRKLLLTGNGKCNYWNDDQDLKHYHSTNSELLDKIITPDNLEKTFTFFTSLGIVPRVRNGYYYPYSMQATAIQTSLIKEIKELGIKVINEEVLSVKYNNCFQIETNKQILKSDYLVIAAGSKACPKTGSTGECYEIAKSFNHNIIKPLPGLVQLKADDILKWDGIRTDVKIDLYENNKYIKTEEGEIQLTDYGVSGICVFNLSSLISRGLDQKKHEEIAINFLPMLNRETFICYMNDRNKRLLNRNVAELLDTFINYKLANLLLKECHIDNNAKWEEIDKNKLAETFLNYKLEITGTNSFESAQVCTGGVPLDEVSFFLESKYQKNLFFTGEILDVNGDCGGYNLSFAFLSGIIVGGKIND